MHSNVPKIPRHFDKRFSLPKRLQETTTLQLLNSHPSDFLIKFDPDNHVYSYDGVPVSISVTSLIEKYFPKFDPDEAISKMKIKEWPRPKYTSPDGKVYTDDEIKQKWDSIGEYSRNRGTWMHYNIDQFLNDLPSNLDSPELKQFLSYHNDYISSPGTVPYRTEWSIYAPDMDVAGEPI
jgi:hypothetical protein